MDLKEMFDEFMKENAKPEPLCIVSQYPELLEACSSLSSSGKETDEQFEELKEKRLALKKQLWDKIEDLLVKLNLITEDQKRSGFKFEDGIIFIQVPKKKSS